MFAHLIKYRSETTLTSDFQTEIFPSCLFLVVTCYKLIKRH
ncbi:hypothetical protein SynPROSU1_02095 [Synechococcus sp. PROS-U-1]|nr:hypothetical protein SynPROSU1_02095 [Synechococcus sp. PROS-U-1]